MRSVDGGQPVIQDLPQFSGDDGSLFVAVQPRLYAVAVRVLGDVGEAEDVVQEAWLRWERADRSDVRSPSAFLSVTATRLAINVARSARKRRERPAGSWLPETVDGGVGPEAAVERREAVGAAIRLVLERLTPAERAAYLLRTAFDYPYRRISEVLQLGADHARQLVRRAHEAVGSGRRRPVDVAVHRRLVGTFLVAAQTGDVGELERLLAADLLTTGTRPARKCPAACVASSGSRPVPSAAR
jgi:RNA polymerase sigma factor (sigma-70 family)